ncbi:MAG TPA: hypothetical protein VH391_04965 [Solirubrobacterales bacterium]
MPVDRAAVRAAAPVLRQLVSSLRSAEVVEPRGVLLGWRLLTDPCSPLYDSPAHAVEPDRLRRRALAVLLACTRRPR